MKKLFLLFGLVVLSFNLLYAQNVVVCNKQTELSSQVTKLGKLYGAEYVEKALKGEIVEGMPENLFLKAFNTNLVRHKDPKRKVYDVFDDKINKRRSPGEKAPAPHYRVICSNGKVIEITKGENKDSNYKVGGGGIIFY